MNKKLEEYSREELIEEIKSLKRRKKFGLVWEDKKEDIVEKCKNEIPVLKEVPELAINEKPGEPTNLIIEGDNFASLQVLNYTHHGKIDVIYIDPPYNTGNKDFIYNDSYVDSEDSFRHSKWLSFMDRRLRLAKELLSDDGVIFISIDEHELCQLKLLCDQVFGEGNYVENFVWIKNSIKNLSSTTSTNHEYVLCYARQIDRLQSQRLFRVKKPGLDEVYRLLSKFKRDKYSVALAEKELKGFYKTNSELKGISMYNNIEIDSNGDYQIFRLSDISAPVAKGALNTYEVLHPVTKRPCRIPNRGWAYSKETMNEHIRNGLIYFNKDETYVPAYKRYLKNVEIEICKSAFTNFDEGKRDLQSVLKSNDLFENPKPVSLIKNLINMVTKDNSYILDFFAGSGTTGQAVLELNKEDGGNRKFILCTNNESNIARDVTYPRIKTVVTGIRPDGSKYSDGISANVRYFTTDFIEKGITGDATRAKLFEKSDEMIQVRENVFELVDKNDNYTFYKNNEKFVAIIKDPFNFGPIWYELEEKNTKKLPVKLYVFSYSNYTFEDEIPDTDLKYEICAIPNSIMEVYRKISDKKEER